MASASSSCLALFGTLFDQATSPTLEEPDWESICAIFDLVRDQKIHPRNVLKSIELKLVDENSKVVIFAIQILDTIVQNCGCHIVYIEVAAKPFLDTLTNVVTRFTRDNVVKTRILGLLLTWSMSFGRFAPYRQISEVVATMKSSGVKFSTVREEDAQQLFEKPPAWIAGDFCNSCGVAFKFHTLLLHGRRHHCRACGQLFCYKCAGKTAILPQFGLERLERLCDPCFEKNTRWKVDYVTSSNTGDRSENLDIDVLQMLLNSLREAQALDEKSTLDMALALSLSETEQQGQQGHLEKGDQEGKIPKDEINSQVDESESSSSDEDEDEDEDDEPFDDLSKVNDVLDSEMVTIDDFRNMIYSDGEREEISVRRETLVQDILLKYSRKANSPVNLLAKPIVSFNLENGLDAGALRKEYFYTGMIALDNQTVGGHPIFEGQADHRLPSTDSWLLTQGIFYAVGRFMVHSCINTNFAFIGLSEVAWTYILMDDSQLTIDNIMKIRIGVEDVPNPGVLEINQTAQKIQRGETKDCSTEELNNLNDAVVEIGFNEPVTHKNAVTFQEMLFFHHVISIRRFQLDEIRAAFKESPLWPFLRSRPYLFPGIFPSSSHLHFPASSILGLIEIEDEDDDEDNDDPVIGHFKDFIVELDKGKIEGATLKQFMELWTGSPIVRGETLHVKVQSGVNFIKVHACFNTFILPKGLSKKELFNQLRVGVVHASKGFDDETLDETLIRILGPAVNSQLLEQLGQLFH